MVIQIVVLLVLTIAAIGGGWGAGMYLRKDAGPAAAGAAVEEPAPRIGDHGGEHGKPPEGKGKEGDLTAPSDVWVRMEASLVFDTPQPTELALAVHQDLLAYLRTLKLHQIEGPSGFQHLKADLEERAKIRSDGHVTQVLIRTLLFE
jgi:flagellar FliL protein